MAGTIDSFNTMINADLASMMSQEYGKYQGQLRELLKKDNFGSFRKSKYIF